jgi:glucokinase
VAAGGEGIRRQITAAVPAVLEEAGLKRDQLAGVGIGFGGPVDDATRTVIKSHQIEGWDGFPLAGWIEEMLGLPAVLGNDADVAGLAEALFGAGKGLSPIFYMTIGSGIGGGLIIDGEVYRGCGRGAAEVGHIQVWSPLAAQVGDTWGWRPLEGFASGWAIGKRAEQLLVRGEGKDSLLLRLVSGNPDQVTAHHVAQAASQQDGFALDVLREAQLCLAAAICHVVALLCPCRIVIGGGVAHLGETLLFEPLREIVAGKVFRPFLSCFDIVPAALGEEVVVHGALALARRRLGG